MGIIADSELKKTKTKMKLFLARLSFLFRAVVTVSAYQCYDVERTLNCYDITDADLPMQLDKFAGHYDLMSLYGEDDGYDPSISINVPKSAFSGVTFDKLVMSMGVKSLDENFLTPHQQSNVTHIELHYFRMKHFPWATVASLSNLEDFIYTHSGLTMVEENIQWPQTVRNIDLGYNNNLTLVKSNAFKSASGLRSLHMWSSSSRIVFEEKSLYTIANNPNFSLYFGDYNESQWYTTMFADDAFGNVAGGELWDTITMKGFQFREETFRLMLKAAFDKNADHLFKSSFGPIYVDGCMDDCSHAWVYKDAQKYGMDEYEKLIGSNGVICKFHGPILSGGDPKLYSHWERCPSTPMPWPQNYCQGVPSTTDVIVDPDNCRCFFHCNHGQTAGHKCCKPGLVFNPELKACDWPYNVPNCV